MPEASRRRRVLQGVGSFAVVAAIFAGLLRNTDTSEVWSAIADMTAPEVASLLVAAAWNLASYTLVLAAVLPGLTLGQATVSSQTSTAISNTLPGGAAFGVATTYAMYSSWGFGAPAITLSVLVSGVWNNFVKLGMPVLALALLALTGDVGAGLVTAALAGLGALAAAVVLFALVLRSDRLAERVGSGLGSVVSALLRPVGRGPVRGWGDAAVRFRADTIDLLRHRWVWLTLATLVSHVSLYVVLLVTLRCVGVSEDEVSWAEVLSAFALVRLVTALPVTPGGLGVVELGLTAALVVAGGDRELVVAGVLLFRALTYLLPIPIGAVTYVIWRRRSSWRDRSGRMCGENGPENGSFHRTFECGPTGGYCR